MSSSCRVIFEDNNVVDLNELDRYYPFSMLESSYESIVVSEFIAQRKYGLDVSSLRYQVAVNLLKQRSSRVNIISALIKLNAALGVRSLISTFISTDFKCFFGRGLKIEISDKSDDFLGDIRFTTLLKKYLINWAYRAIGKIFFVARRKTDSVVRVWVELDDKLHRDYIDKCQVFVYPFGINLARGFRFIREAYRRYDNVQLNGVPYKAKDLFRVLVSNGIKRDLAIVDYELGGYLSHSHDFRLFKSVYTSDEFIPATIGLYKILSEVNGINVTNVCHGVGCYNPYVSYTNFFAINTIQKRFYSYRSEGLNINVCNNPSFGLRRRQYSKFLFIDQGELNSYGLGYEGRLQDQLLVTFESLNEYNGTSIIVKFHPNREMKSRLNMERKYPNLKFIDNVLDIDEETLVISLFSTAVFDYCDKLDVICISTDFFKPDEIIENEISCVNISSIRDFIIKKRC